MNRLLTIASQCEGFKTVVDFGCDHGLTLKLAFDHFGVKQGYAVDNKDEPLNKARQNLGGYNVNFYKCSKLSQFTQILDKKDTFPELIIITGMGCQSICDIIDIFPLTTFLVSAHTKNYLLRQFITKHSLEIIKEIIVKEDNFYYELIMFQKGKQVLSDAQLHTGIYLSQNSLFKEYANFQIKKYSSLLLNVPKARQKYFQKLIEYWDAEMHKGDLND